MRLDPGTSDQTWTVVGGGMLGLTLAWRLARSGRKVTVLEAAPELGGLASAWKIGDIVWDRHYHVTLLSDAALRGLLAELNLDSKMQWRESATGFYAGGRHYSMSGPLDFFRFPPLNAIDKLRLGHTILRASRIRNSAAVEGITVEKWLRRHSGDRGFERFWLPLLRSKLGESYRETSAAFIWATINRLFGARRSGLDREMFGYLPGGYANLLGCFAERLARLGVRIETGRRALRVGWTDGRLRVLLEGGRSAVSDRVVCTLPSPQAMAVCTGLYAHEKAAHQAIRYQGIVCASVLMNGALSPYYVTNLLDGWVPFTGVIDMSALVDRDQFGGAGLVYLPKYVAPDDELFAESDTAIRTRFLAALSRMYPGFKEESVRDFKVSRVRHVFPIPSLHYSKRVPPVQTSIPGLYILNSSHIVNGTLNVNQTVELANRAADEMTSAQPQTRMAA